MIYKETESVNDKQQEVPDDKIQENILRGEKLIAKSKKSIQTIILADLFIFVMGITTLSLGSHFLDNLFLIIYPILSLFIFFMLFSTVSIYYKWLYHILRNLRKFTETRFFPKDAAVGSLFPGIGQFMTFFIFKDILTRQKEILEKNGVHSAPIPTLLLLTPLIPAAIFFLFFILTLGIIKSIQFWAFIFFASFFFPIIRYVFIFKVVFDIFAIITLLIYMKLVQQPILNEKAIAQLNIGNIKATNPDKEINPEINGSPAENDEIPQDNP
jgi:hypothetical protein